MSLPPVSQCFISPFGLSFVFLNVSPFSRFCQVPVPDGPERHPLWPRSQMQAEANWFCITGSSFGRGTPSKLIGEQPPRSTSQPELLTEQNDMEMMSGSRMELQNHLTKLRCCRGSDTKQHQALPGNRVARMEAMGPVASESWGPAGQSRPGIHGSLATFAVNPKGWCRNTFLEVFRTHGVRVRIASFRWTPSALPRGAFGARA